METHSLIDEINQARHGTHACNRAVLGAIVASFIRTLNDAIAAIGAKFAIGQASSKGRCSDGVILIPKIACFRTVSHAIAAMRALLAVRCAASVASIIDALITGFACPGFDDCVSAHGYWATVLRAMA